MITVQDQHELLYSLKLDKFNKGVCTGSNWYEGNSATIKSYSPVDGEFIASVSSADLADFKKVLVTAQDAFIEWRMWPAPKRGEIVRQLGNSFRENKDVLGRLISYEMGKSLQEGLGEVQEIIDICDFAVGVSRQLHGYTMASERPEHRLYEQYHPLGIVGIITAFNFPAAVWGWNAMLSLVCGDVCIWKPSEKTPLCAVACHKIVQDVFVRNQVPEGVCSLVIGDREVGKWMCDERSIALVSATGSTAMGKAVGMAVAARMGRSLLELGGNNAMIVSQHADLSQAIEAIVFGAIGTAGQRCTTTRRLIVHETVYDHIKNQLVKAYRQIKIGNPMDPVNHMGPLIDQDAVKTYLGAIDQCIQEGGNFIVEGGQLIGDEFSSGCYVKPCIAEVHPLLCIVSHETFAPILYMMKYSTLEEAVHIQNNVPQGLSSAIMSLHAREVEYFLSARGSDCGIANVNMGTSGAEIGGAFGGEKETGGGRESGSDAWKYYMRRQTNTINYSARIPLSQGISFKLDG